ncbi:MAG TPA: hypothetical protein VHC48_15540 [Puia sp.]|nr:hypothetical protein [Puia sp.]
MKPLLVLSIVILSTATSCRKVYDYIHDHPDAHDSLCQVTKINLPDAYGVPIEADISYNSKGNPTTMFVYLPGHPPGPAFIAEVNRWFRYDKYDRLLYYYVNFPPGDGGPPADPNVTTGLGFHKYAYPRPDFITDSLIFYPSGSSYPPIYDSATGTSITGYTLDAKGRISKVWNLSRDPRQPPQLIREIVYDANGNLPLPDSSLSYDDKVNPYRTNKIWQFVFNDYSRNNMVKIDYFYFTQYNTFGLPLNLRNLQAPPYYHTLFDMDSQGVDLTFTYACSPPKGPINY